MSSIEWAKEIFDEVRISDTPSIVAYWGEDSKLLLYSMNSDAANIFGHLDTEKFLKERKGTPLSFLIKTDKMNSLTGCNEREFPASLVCQKANKKASIRAICFEGEGIIFKIKLGATLPSLPAISSINKGLKGLTELFKNAQMAMAALVSIVVAVFGFSIAPWSMLNPTEVQAAREDTTREQIDSIIQQELNKFPRGDKRVRHNGVSVSKYLNNLDSRQLYAGEIEGISRLNKKALNVKSTKEDGWRQQLDAHIGDSDHPRGKMHIISKKEYAKKDPAHSLVVAMDNGGVESVMSYPIYKDNILHGYVSVGLKDEISQLQEKLVEERLSTIATRVEIATDFPN